MIQPYNLLLKSRKDRLSSNAPTVIYRKKDKGTFINDVRIFGVVLDPLPPPCPNFIYWPLISKVRISWTPSLPLNLDIIYFTHLDLYPWTKKCAWNRTKISFLYANQAFKWAQKEKNSTRHFWKNVTFRFLPYKAISRIRGKITK